MKPLSFIIGGGIAYLIYRGISSIKIVPIKKPQSAENLTRLAQTSNLSAEVEFEVSGLEKTLGAKGQIEDHIGPIIALIRTVVCEKMPVLSQERPKVLLTSSHIGYIVRVDWPATFTDTTRGDVPISLRNCIYQGIISQVDPRVKPRIKRFRVFRD